MSQNERKVTCHVCQKETTGKVVAEEEEYWEVEYKCHNCANYQTEFQYKNEED